MTEGEQLVEEIKQQTKVMLVDAAMKGADLYLTSLDPGMMTLMSRYVSQSGSRNEKVLFAWRLETKHRPISLGPIPAQEAIQYIEDNWSNRIWSEPR